MQQGLTLVELLVTVAIIGIVAGMAVPLIADAVATQELHIFVDNLAADIRGLQQLGVNANGTQTIYTLYWIGGSRPQYNLHDREKAIKIVDFPASVAVTGDPQFIRYAITGSPSFGAQTIEFRSKRTGEYLYVVIASVTGRVRVCDAAGLE